MIGTTLQFVCDVLDQYIQHQFGLEETKVVLNGLMETSGAVPSANQNMVVISLINIEKESAKAFYGRYQRQADGNFSDVNPFERYNLDLLISANFDNYKETLKFLSAVMAFFQAHPCLDTNSYSTLPPGLPKLEFEIEKINYQDMQGLWTAMGAKYQPSVIYKMRFLTIQAAQVQSFAPAVTQTKHLAIP
jgi:hypothetical protein